MSRKKVFKATHEGNLTIGDLEIPCYVLEDGTRVISQRGLQKSIGMSTGGGRKGARRISSLIDRFEKKGVDIKDLAARANSSIVFTPTHGGNLAFGYEATFLSDLCEIILQARKAGLLTKHQEHYAEIGERVMRSFAKVGIIAVVDEATGYQNVRSREALQEILEKFIAEELRPWMKTFNDEFYKQIFRLNNWPYDENSIKKRPAVVGRWTNDIVYDRLAPGVRVTLHKKAGRDEQGRLKYHLHRWLTDQTGHPKLREHLAAVVALMKASNNWKEFKRLLERSLPKHTDQLPLDFGED